jgi:hypothetical protein
LCREPDLAGDPVQQCREAFCLALLLTGSAEQAEAAVTEALQLWNPDDPIGEYVLRQVAKSCADPEPPRLAGGPAVPERAARLLPGELLPVPRLPLQYRRCFVLRILMGRSKQASARILDLSISQVDRYTCAALVRLPDLQSPTSPTAYLTT